VDHFRIGGGSLGLVQRITEDSPNVPGVAENYDHFGSVLTPGSTVTAGGSYPVVTGPPRLYVGTPYEDVGSARDAGSVGVLYQAADTGLVTRGTVVSQDSSGIGGTAETGDHFGAALASAEPNGEVPTAPILFVGTPDEAIGSIRHAGTVQGFAVSSTHGFTQVRTISQESPGVPGASESGDRFGAALALSSGCTFDDPAALAIGAPGESIGSATSAGAITLVTARPEFSGTPTVCPMTLSQGLGGTSGAPEAGDRFGAAIGEWALPYDPGDTGFGHVIGGGLFVVGAPGEDLGGKVDAGVVQFAREPSAFYDTAGTAAGENYGASLAWSVPNFACFC
jgi:hypothetical protein